MESINWTVVVVVGMICYTLYAIADLGNAARFMREEHQNNPDDNQDDE